ncbi:hypothetical protein SDC9_98416 [bioreactor metagenome]|uniref:Uncharacterized protein n=1 Tax=bioreactor metagenome TaxID=1076179 RepID=A0A645AEN7_9ZZZZ
MEHIAGKRREDAVSLDMPEAVVYLLEIIDVDDKKGVDAAGSFSVKKAFHAFDGGFAVEHPRQRVAVRHCAQLLQAALFFVYICKAADNALEFSVGIKELYKFDAYPEKLSRGVFRAKIKGMLPIAAVDVSHIPPYHLAVFFKDL